MAYIMVNPRFMYVSKQYLYILFGITIWFISCRKETPASSNASPSYELVSMVWSGPTTNGESYYFTYDSTHLLTDYKQIQWGQGGYNITDSGNIPSPGGWADTTYYHLEYNSDHYCIQQSVDDALNGMEGYWTYTYNNKGWLTETDTYYANGQPEYYTYVYSYNDNGQVTDMRQYGYASALEYHDTYAYDSSGDLSTEVDSTLYMNPAWIQITTYTSYDNKVNFVKALSGYITTTSTLNNFGVASSISPNNPLTTNEYGSIQPGDPFGLLSTTTCTYRYNDAGLPVQEQTGPWTITYTYQKY